MLTLFSAPKPFHGHIDVIQRNAIGSWRRLVPACTLVLCGEEPGLADVARQLGAIHLPNIRRNDMGTPQLDSIFEESCRAATTPLVCYLNADIILLPTFVEAVRRIPLDDFLMIGQRTTVEQTTLLDFDDSQWAIRLAELAKTHGQLDGPTFIDYMLFRKDGPLRRLPPFAVGRPGWDNWFVENARKLNVPVIDATGVVRVLHQKHDYAHVKQARGPRWEGPEAIQNRRLAGWPVGGRGHAYSVRDATHLLTPHGLKTHTNWHRVFPVKIWAKYPLRLGRRWLRKVKIAVRMARRPLRLLSFCRYSVRLKTRIAWQRLQGLFVKRTAT